MHMTSHLTKLILIGASLASASNAGAVEVERYEDSLRLTFNAATPRDFHYPDGTAAEFKKPDHFAYDTFPPHTFGAMDVGPRTPQNACILATAPQQIAAGSRVSVRIKMFAWHTYQAVCQNNVGSSSRLEALKAFDARITSGEKKTLLPASLVGSMLYHFDTIEDAMVPPAPWMIYGRFCAIGSTITEKRSTRELVTVELPSFTVSEESLKIEICNVPADWRGGISAIEIEIALPR